MIRLIIKKSENISGKKKVARIKYDAELMGVMSLFTKVTGVDAKDVIRKDKHITFLVGQGKIGQAIGRKALNIRKLENKLNRKIKIVEFNPALKDFVANMILPLEAKDITVKGSSVIITGKDAKSKGLLIGRESRNLKQLKETVKRYFDINEIKVV